MIFTFNPAALLAPIRVILNADATLRDSDHLDQAEEAMWTYSAPSDAELAYLVLTSLPVTPAGQSQFGTEVRIFCHYGLLQSGQIDPRGDATLSQCETLLNNVSPAITGGTCQPLFSLGLVPSFVDTRDRSKSRGVLRLRGMVGIDG